MLFTSSSKSTFGADEGTRTPTPLALVPKTSASTSSATSAIIIATDKLSTFSDKLINIIAGAIEKVFKVNDKKEIEEPKKETKKLAKKEE